jgi:CRISPR-associated protein Cmr1
MPRLALDDVPENKTITATFEIVTPMFIGDADQKATAMRPTSIKGALRFWWRALNGHLSLSELAKEEARLFGSTKGGGVFSLAVEQKNIITKPLNITSNKNPADNEKLNVSQISPHAYLLGQGLSDRNAIIEGKFTITILFNPKTTGVDQQEEKDRQQIKRSLQLFGILGALGSRARHGWGSVSMTTVSDTKDISIPKTKEEYQQLLQSFLNGKTPLLPDFTAFSSKSRIDISGSHKNPMTLLSNSGHQLQLYRSYGLKRNGKNEHMVGDTKAKQKFTSDHDLILDHIQGTKAKKAPDRVVFGLPHNYRFSNNVGDACVDATISGEQTRRASPLFTHIQKIGTDYFLIHALLPAVFLPEKEGKIVISTGKKFDGNASSSSVVTPCVDWSVVTKFMDEFQGATKVLPQ